MSTLRNCLIALGVFGLFHAVAAASPIQVNLAGGVDGYSYNTSFTLSDPSQPIVISLPLQEFMTSDGPNGYYGSGNINSNLGLTFSVGPVSPPSMAAVSVAITGNIQGGYSVISPGQPNMSGSVYGVGTNASLSLSQGTTPADVPPYLADLLKHPERVVVSGTMTGGPLNLLQTTLTIGPPVDPSAGVSVPEPSMLLTFLTVLTCLPIARRMRSSQSVDMGRAAPGDCSPVAPMGPDLGGKLPSMSKPLSLPKITRPSHSSCVAERSSRIKISTAATSFPASPFPSANGSARPNERPRDDSPEPPRSCPASPPF
jgi:hypothetical protein